MFCLQSHDIRYCWQSHCIRKCSIFVVKSHMTYNTDLLCFFPPNIIVTVLRTTIWKTIHFLKNGLVNGKKQNVLVLAATKSVCLAVKNGSKKSDYNNADRITIWRVFSVRYLNSFGLFVFCKISSWVLLQPMSQFQNLQYFQFHAVVSFSEIRTIFRFVIGTSLELCEQNLFAMLCFCASWSVFCHFINFYELSLFSLSAETPPWKRFSRISVNLFVALSTSFT